MHSKARMYNQNGNGQKLQLWTSDTACEVCEVARGSSQHYTTDNKSSRLLNKFLIVVSLSVLW